LFKAIPGEFPVSASESSDAMKGIAQVTMSMATKPESSIDAFPFIVSPK
jgi:hypothetical protein